MPNISLRNDASHTRTCMRWCCAAGADEIRRPIPEMNLSRHDVWGHFAPMFHLVDVFAVYAITLVGGRHVTLPAFSPQEVLLAIGERATPPVLCAPACHSARAVQDSPRCTPLLCLVCEEPWLLACRPAHPLRPSCPPASTRAERERVSATNVASTMVAMLINNPLVEQLDLTSLRVLSCGGSPQSPAGETRSSSGSGAEWSCQAVSTILPCSYIPACRVFRWSFSCADWPLDVA